VVGEGAAPAESRFPLASLPPGERVRVIHQGRPVELRREGGRVVARSLTCTHFACEVRWRPDEEDYLCPCHDGRFGPNGRVLGGPPNRPLPELPVRIEGSAVILEL
jgi:cytochrome b6-f complex iron-sulfur subunit